MMTTTEHDTQERLNALANDPDLTVDDIRDRLIEAAEAALAQYPQYKGKWDGPEWQVGRVRRARRYKGGRRFEVGDIVLVKPHPTLGVAFSHRGSVDCGIEAGDVEVMS